MTVALGPQRTVVLVGYEAVKDALVDHADDFIGRGPLPFLMKVTRGYGNALHLLKHSNSRTQEELFYFFFIIKLHQKYTCRIRLSLTQIAIFVNEKLEFGGQRTPQNHRLAFTHSIKKPV